LQRPHLAIATAAVTRRRVDALSLSVYRAESPGLRAAANLTPAL
jgi:RNase P/RNase MRP subunit p30